MKKQNIRRLLALTLASVISAANPSYSKAYEPINNEDEMLEKEMLAKALQRANIRKLPDINSEVIGKTKIGEVLKLYTNLENGWCEVEYDNDIAYISSEEVSIFEKYYEKDTDTKLGVILKDTYITDEALNYKIEKNEVVEILSKGLNGYLVEYNDIQGFLSKEDVERLIDTFVIVDISDQILKLYEHNEVILEVPVVTGTPTPSRSTDEGLYEIYDISYNRDLIGENNSYRSYVDVMMKFNKGEGLHDAEYHKDYNAAGKLVKSHGWRSKEEFGGTTYLNNGSHGCVNMMHDDAIEVSKHVALNTKVLIKK